MTGCLPSSESYTGKLLDDETGLQYFNARQFDPVQGRFISSDSVLGDVSNPQTFNKYVYVMNSPFRFH